MSNQHGYSREVLAEAVAASHSWRGVLRYLGRPEQSAGALRVVRREVDAFGIDHSHFTGQRRWSDSQLASAVAASRSWSEILRRLEISGGSHVSVRAHAVRLGLDTSHLGPTVAGHARVSKEPELDNLRVAGPTLAAGWFMLCGFEVLWPLEPCRYDIGIRLNGQLERIQVKTVTFRSGGAFTAQLSNSRRPGHREVYDVDEVDSFFVIDAELNAYWIPFAEVAGYGQISLRSYRGRLVAQRGQWLSTPPLEPTTSACAFLAPARRSRWACR